MQTEPSSPMTTENARRKLLLHEKVEVRSVEEGFLGSWHAGTVIGCEDLARVVQYDHLLNDEGSNNLTEEVKVSPIVDGVASGGIGMSDNYRGFIRPLPPSSVLGPWCLHYGQCVDFFYEDAWWEGVIFDHEDGCEKRRIFFPDMGDEMEARIDILRLSKDWDEVTEEWKPRGNWLFLELIEEVEQDWPLPVSVKQVWYEVRMKNGFEKLREWTSSGRYIWRELVLQVLFDNFKITVQQLFIELNSSWDSEELGQSLLEFSEPAFDVVLKTEGLFQSSHAVVPFEATFQFDNELTLPTDLRNCQKVPEQNDQSPISTMLTNEQAVSTSNFTLPILSRNPDEDTVIDSNKYNEAPGTSFKLPHTEPSISTQKKRIEWKPAVPELIPGAEFCPNAIDECKEMSRLKRRLSNTVTLNAWKHLLHLGWKIDFALRDGKKKLRYFSPDGKLFYSFRKICLMFDNVCPELGPGSPMIMSPNIGRNGPVSLPEETNVPLLAGKSRASSKPSKLCTPSDELVIEPEYCPEAVRDYYFLGQKNQHFYCAMGVKGIALKAKKHLSAIGWSFYYHPKGGKKELRYTSPSGELFYSLISACKCCVEASALTSSDLSRAIGRMGNVNIIRDFDDHLSVNPCVDSWVNSFSE
ncbi:hypothetical protein DH2020_022067 [Rehmannia glutinosa]|uniref:Agenet domain-containing protein n=1 Tax=Rehmannia glutinosa TaxID=99300 RepID=A0ABR0WC97_REHGL